MNVGVIGVGAMGKNHVRIYAEFKAVDKVYIYDINEEATKWICNRHKDVIVICKTIDSLLEKVEAVSICTPTKDHYEITKEAIERKVNCLIEKPVSLNLEEGESLLKYLNNNLVIGVGHIERFNPVIREVKSLLQRPRYIEIKRHNPQSLRISDSDVVLDLMVHDIDLVWNYFLSGISYEVYSFWESDLCKVIAKFNDCTVSLSASRVSCKKIRNIYVEDEGFSIDGDFMSHDVYVYRKPQKYTEEESRYMQENIIAKVLVNKIEPLKEELKMFIECVQEDKQFPVTVEQAVVSLRIAEEIKRKGK